MAGRKPGTPKTGGRAKGIPNRKTRSLLQMCEDMDFNPFQAMLEIAKEKHNPDAPMMLKEVCQYLYPKRKSLEHSASIDPKMMEAAEELEQMSKEEKILMLEEEIKRLKE